MFYCFHHQHSVVLLYTTHQLFDEDFAIRVIEIFSAGSETFHESKKFKIWETFRRETFSMGQGFNTFSKTSEPGVMDLQEFAPTTPPHHAPPPPHSIIYLFAHPLRLPPHPNPSPPLTTLFPLHAPHFPYPLIPLFIRPTLLVLHLSPIPPYPIPNTFVKLYRFAP